VDNGSIATTDAQSMESMEHSQERTIAADQTGLLFVSGQSSSTCTLEYQQVQFEYV
jgi:hypothetical protein